MIHTIDITVLPEVATAPEQLKYTVADVLQVSVKEISAVQVLRRSIDARRGRPHWQLKVQVYMSPLTPKGEQYEYRPASLSPHEAGKAVIIVGAGPAGLFAALKLIERGLRPIILERGKNVSERKYDIAKLTREHFVNPHSNWCFGEGGAGTFSDGKLYTRSNKRGNITEILQQLVYHGANPDILIDTHAHIGTNKLPRIMANIRKTIEDCGGKYYFNTHITDLIVQNRTVKGAIAADGTRYEGVAVILATGHSARDIYELFARKQWAFEAKPFAMGVRAEHPQALINELQYHGRNYSPLLPQATYNLVTQVQKRGVFSFCMCPGGLIVPAATASGELVVNGMSNSQRNSPFANAGIVAQVNLTDLHSYEKYGALAGLRFQQDVEQRMFAAANRSQAAPAQRMLDFVKGKASSSLGKTSYMAGTPTNAPLHELLPGYITKSLQQAFKDFDRKMRGYLSAEAMLVAVESRTSSPVRILRHPDTLEHVQLSGLYPCGEGAGYAGGITSSAIDGVNCAEQIAIKINRLSI